MGLWTLERGLAVVGMAALAPGATAQLLGQPLLAEWRFPNADQVLEGHEFVVGDGVELPRGEIANSGQLAIDVGDNTVTFRLYELTGFSDAPFNGWRFEDINNGIPAVLGYEIESYSPTLQGVDAIFLYFDENSFAADFANVQATDVNDFITLRVVFDFCRADFNRDGFLDFFDYGEFVACFEGGACAAEAADFNQDDFVDLFDYIDFVEAFEAGC